jgi:hypothetical protein
MKKQIEKLEEINKMPTKLIIQRQNMIIDNLEGMTTRLFWIEKGLKINHTEESLKDIAKEYPSSPQKQTEKCIGDDCRCAKCNLAYQDELAKDMEGQTEKLSKHSFDRKCPKSIDCYVCYPERDFKEEQTVEELVEAIENNREKFLRGLSHPQGNRYSETRSFLLSQLKDMMRKEREAGFIQGRKYGSDFLQAKEEECTCGDAGEYCPKHDGKYELPPLYVGEKKYDTVDEMMKSEFPTPQHKEMEARFERKFAEDRSGSNSVGIAYIDAPESKIKDFINSELHTAQKEWKEKVKEAIPEELNEKDNYFDGNSWNSCRENLIKNLKDKALLD